MTTAPPGTIDWIRFTIVGAAFTLSPSPDFDLRLAVVHGERTGYQDPLTVGPLPSYSLAVDLIPLRPHDFAAVARCEARAREMATRLGVADVDRYDFALEAGLGGEGLPYNRMEAPRLQLVAADLPEFDGDEPLQFVRVLTARMVADSAGVAYVMRQAD
ncbi:hypothetical protein [Streptomyces sp. NPDC003832]